MAYKSFLPLLLILAHLAAELLQTEGLVRGKDDLRSWPYILHGFSLYFWAVALIALFSAAPLQALRLHFFLLLLAASHLILDRLHRLVLQRRWMSEASAWCLDQTLHLAVLGYVGLTLTAGFWSTWLRVQTEIESQASRILLVIVVYVAVIFGGGQLIRWPLAQFRAQLDKQGEMEETQGLDKAGLYIGWLERFFVLTAILYGAPAAAGLIVAAKSVFRFPEIKGRPFAEYFLIGTLLSVALAVLGGLLLRFTLLSPSE
jgi:hypothetical protein